MSRKHPPSKRITGAAGHRRNKSSRQTLFWLWIVLGAVLLVIVGSLVFKPGNKTTDSNIPGQATSAVLEISPAEAYAKYQNGAFILDVRTQAEWDQVHISGSTLIPLDQLQDRLNEIPVDKDIVVICQTGHRAQSGTAILLAAGYKHVSCLNGGLNAWVEAGYPIEGTPQ
jgi:phage shock protein E